MAVRRRPTFIEYKVSGFLRRKRGRDVLRAIDRGMLEAGRQMVPVVQRFTPVDRGFLKQSYQVRRTSNPRRLIISSTSPPGKVGAMETGRRPGTFPPVAAIRAWVARKLKVAPKDIPRVAFLVGRKIAMEGIQVPLVKSGLGAMFRRAIAALGPNFIGRQVTLAVRRLK